MLLLACASAYATTTGTNANEVIVDFSDNSIPVLNQILRKTEADIKTVQAAIPTTPSTVAATQADMEATTSTTTFASPARMQFSQSSAKAWCMFNGATVGTNAPTVGYNVSSVTRISTGSYRISYTYPFSSANYSTVGMGNDTGSSQGLVYLTGTQQATSTTILVTNASGSVQDLTRICLTAFGDQ